MRLKRVFEHGFVGLVDSMPSRHFDAMRDQYPIEEPAETVLGPGDRRVAEAARVSLGVLEKEDRSDAQNIKLLEYMMKHGHTTPFEQVRFTFVVKATIMDARQWFRHRTGSFNEQSARYGELDNEFYVPSVERMQKQSTANKQGSAEQLPYLDVVFLRESIIEHSEAAYALYKKQLDRGLTRELARMVLPVNFYTSFYWTTDLHNLMGFLTKRLPGDAQFEIRQYAEALAEFAEEVAPLSMRLFREYRLGQK